MMGATLIHCNFSQLFSLYLLRATHKPSRLLYSLSVLVLDSSSFFPGTIEGLCFHKSRLRTSNPTPLSCYLVQVWRKGLTQQHCYSLWDSLRCAIYSTTSMPPRMPRTSLRFSHTRSLMSATSLDSFAMASHTSRRRGIFPSRVTLLPFGADRPSQREVECSDTHPARAEQQDLCGHFARLGQCSIAQLELHSLQSLHCSTSSTSHWRRRGDYGHCE